MSIDYDLPEEEYHAHPALSPSGAKSLLACPARYHWQRHHPAPPKDAYDFGHVAHELVLGRGAGIKVIDAEDWRTKAAKEQRDAARAEGLTPILRKVHDEAVELADAVLDHPVAGAIFTDDAADAEVSMFWESDDQAPLRGRLDWLQSAAIVDLKTTAEGGANPDKIERTIYDFGYHISAAAYEEGAHATGLIEGPVPHLLVVVEKTAPYPVTVVQLSDTYLEMGREKWHQAIALHAECTATGVWPTYTNEIPTMYPPRWAS